MADQTLSITLGALAPKLHTQLGTPAPARGTPLWHIQADADAVSRLAVRAIITEREAHAARKRLMRKLQKYIREAPK